MERIKECPFCGQYPKIVEKKNKLRTRNNHTDGMNMKLIGNTGFSYIWEQTRYLLLCPDTHCPGHNNNFCDFNKNNLVERWNRRVQ